MLPKLIQLKNLTEETALEYIEDGLEDNSLTENHVHEIADIIRNITTTSKNISSLNSQITALKTKYPLLSQKLVERLKQYV